MSGPDDLLRELYPSIVAPTVPDIGPDDPTVPELPHVPDDEDEGPIGLPRAVNRVRW